MIAPDTSVVIASLVPWHTLHATARAALAGRSRALPVHVAFETTSTLSRMPAGRRLAPSVILSALEHDYPSPWLVLDADGARTALERAVAAGVGGGALYDALVAATVAHHGVRLVSADRRARRTYQAVGVDAEYLGLG